MEFAKCVIFLHYISDEIKTKFTTQSNIPVSNVVLFLTFQF